MGVIRFALIRTRFLPIVIAGSLSACRAGTWSDAPPPDPVASDSILAPTRESRFVLDASVDLSAIARKLDSETPVVIKAIDTTVSRQATVTRGEVANGIATVSTCVFSIGRKCDRKDNFLNVSATVRLQGDVRRAGAVELRGLADTLVVLVPVSAQVTARPVSGVWKDLGLRETASASMVVTIKLVPRIDSLWQPSLGIAADFAYRERPQITLFDFVPVTFGSELEGPIRGILSQLESDVRMSVAQGTTSARVDSVWRTLFDAPIALDSATNSWLVLQPTEASYEGITVTDGIARTRIAITAKTSAHAGQRPTVAPSVRPTLHLARAKDSVTSLRVPIAVNLTAAGTAIERAVVAHGPFKLPVDSDTLEVAVEQVKTYASSGVLTLALLAKAKFKARTVNGWLHLQGRPTLDASGAKIALTDLRFTAATDQPILNGAVRLANFEPIARHIERQARYDLGPQAKETIAQLNAYLTPAAGREGLALSGTVSRLGIDNLQSKGNTLIPTVLVDAVLRVTFGR
jgi:hypothetical protein